jgi:hypothetical protein
MKDAKTTTMWETLGTNDEQKRYMKKNLMKLCKTNLHTSNNKGIKIRYEF